MAIDPQARVHPGAVIGDGATVGPFAEIGPNVVIGDRCEIRTGAIVIGHTTMGRDNVVHPYAVIGGPPQDLKYDGEPTRVEIGDRNTFREGVTINVGTVGGGGLTKLGDDNLVMANAHVAHDCIVGSGTILSNNVMLAGHTVVQDMAILNGGAAVHHFTTIGRLCYIGGLTPITQDIPPFLIAANQPLRYGGVNVVGLRRRGFDDDTIEDLRAVFKRMFRTAEPVTEVIAAVRAEGDSIRAEVRELTEFVAAMERGFHGRSLEATRRRGR